MIDLSQIAEHDEVIGADGVHIGTVDHARDGRIQLIKKDSHAEIEGAGQGEAHHHFIPGRLVASIADGVVRLSANADVAITFEEEEDGAPIDD